MILPAFAAIALGAAACSSGAATGTPTATSAPATTSSSDSSSSGDGNSLASVDPCGLLTQQQVSQLGLTAEGPANNAESKGCGWRKGPTYSLGFYIYQNRPIDAVGSNGASKVTLQSHDAVETTASGTGCAVEIEVSRTSTVLVTTDANSGLTQSCRIAEQYATLIEPKLPAEQK
jgi:hypothetical protein